MAPQKLPRNRNKLLFSDPNNELTLEKATPEGDSITVSEAKRDFEIVDNQLTKKPGQKKN